MLSVCPKVQLMLWCLVLDKCAWNLLFKCISPFFPLPFIEMEIAQPLSHTEKKKYLSYVNTVK